MQGLTDTAMQVDKAVREDTTKRQTIAGCRYIKDGSGSQALTSQCTSIVMHVRVHNIKDRLCLVKKSGWLHDNLAPT